MASYDDEELKEITLSPEVRRIRNSIIKKFAHEPLDIMAKFVKDVVENEKDTVKRLGAMAARVEILRMRISQISNDSKESNFDDITEEITEDEDNLSQNLNDIVITSPNLSDWVRLRIIENSEINGVRFPTGVVIDVSQEDGDRLLESGKASYVKEDDIADVKSDVNLQKHNDLEVSEEDTGAPDKTTIEEGLLEDVEGSSAVIQDLEVPLEDSILAEKLDDNQKGSDQELEKEASNNLEVSEEDTGAPNKTPKEEGQFGDASESSGVIQDSDILSEDSMVQEKPMANKKSSSSELEKDSAKKKSAKKKPTNIPELDPTVSDEVSTVEDMLAGFEVEDSKTEK